ncbi:Na/Pi cotransporter family protein [soil metagenome]
MTATGVIFGLLQVLGSLGVFLYGMKVGSEGVQRVAGDRMRRIMATMTQNRFAALFTGFLMTCLVQSSSASTVIVVSFVNAGLLTLVESIGVIMGANLGTTLTAWIIALVGKFSLSTFALPVIGVGLPLFFIGKGKKRSVGEILIGFGLLFFGLSLLKDSVPNVQAMLTSDNPEDVAAAEAVRAFVTTLSGYGFGSVILFVILGVVLTLTVQSSSAAMAITVMLSISGWIDFSMGAAIVMGENIGTTVTAYLASLGANANAKRAARAHFLFNIIGVVWMLVLFWPFTRAVAALGELLFSFPAVQVGEIDSQVGFNLALFHSLFNLTNIILLIGFVPMLARVVERWVSDPALPPGASAASPPRLKYISQGMVDVGELNLPEAENAIKGLAKLTSAMFVGFREVIVNPEVELSGKVAALKAMEEDSDHMTADITQYLVLTSTAEISDANARSIGAMVRIASELEEVADCIYRLIKLAQRRYNEHRVLTPEATDSIDALSTKVTETIDFYNAKLFRETTAEDLRRIDELERALDDLRRAANESAVARMQDSGDVRAELLTIDLCNHLEKIGNHAFNMLEENYRIGGGDPATALLPLGGPHDDDDDA